MKSDIEHYGPGRPSFPETLEQMRVILREVKREPGVPSVKVARKLGIDALKCASLAKRLQRRGLLRVGHNEGRAILLFPVD